MTENELLISKYLTEEAPSFACYDVIRKCASMLDGFKLSHRKIMWTMLENFNNPNTRTKTSQMAATVSLRSQYLHGEANLEGVIDTMAANFVSGNNYPLLTGHGSFGTRFSPEAAAGRYTFVSISPLASILFPKDDRILCGNQEFEGDIIEPGHFVPIFPVLFLNGSEGLSTGFKQQVYPRDPKDIIKYIEAKISNAPKCIDINKCVPYFKGFKGSTKIIKTKDPNGNLKIDVVNFGVIEKKNSALLHITEIPVTYTYSSYINFLDKLCEKSELINGYDDLCDPKTDNFEFNIRVKREFFNQNPDEADWIKYFGLNKNLNEQLNCVDENNHIKEYDKISDILDDFIKIRLEFYKKRKDYQLKTLVDNLKLDVSKFVFCKGVIEDTIKIRNIAKDKIIAQLETVDKIIKKDDSFDYLLNMPISSITKEKLAKLKDEITELKGKINMLKSKNEVDLWLEDLAELKKVL